MSPFPSYSFYIHVFLLLIGIRFGIILSSEFYHNEPSNSGVPTNNCPAPLDFAFPWCRYKDVSLPTDPLPPASDATSLDASSSSSTWLIFVWVKKAHPLSPWDPLFASCSVNTHSIPVFPWYNLLPLTLPLFVKLNTFPLTTLPTEFVIIVLDTHIAVGSLAIELSNMLLTISTFSLLVSQWSLPY